jgi:ribosome-binding factor A
MDSHRARRVSEALREELDEMIAYELSDPRVADTAVTEVLISPDLKHAKVRLHVSKDAMQLQETIRALEGARHFLRHQLAERLSLFRIPDLHFEADVSLASDARLDSLLKRVRRGRPRDAQEQ